MAIARPKYRYVSEPHRLEDPTSDCQCNLCEGYRAERIVPGCLARPVFNRDSRSRTPWWRLGEWRRSGWFNKFQSPETLTVIGDIPPEDKDCGHLGAVLCMSPEFGLVVTIKSWLVRLDLPYVRPV